MIDKTEIIICPRCGTDFLKYLAALSRRDNKTLICSKCGKAEAFEDFISISYSGKPYWEKKE